MVYIQVDIKLTYNIKIDAPVHLGLISRLHCAHIFLGLFHDALMTLEVAMGFVRNLE